MAESSLYPTSLDSTNLYEVVARLSTTLTADITASTTTIPLASTTGFPTQGYIVIDNETIAYSSVSVGSVDATGGRGHAGTAASHTDTTQVLVAVVAAVINKLRAGMLAVQGKVGISGSTNTTTLEYKITHLPGQTTNTQVTNLNAQYLGGSTEGQLNAGYLGGSTEGQLNVDLVDGIEGVALKANEIIIMADGFKIDGSSCELVEEDGTANKCYCKHLAVAKTEWFDVPKFKVPDTYDGGDIDISVCFRSAGVSKTHSLGIRVASVATGEAHNPDTAAAYQLYDEEASDADIGEVTIKTVTVTQANHLMVAGEIWHCKCVVEDDAGADADDVLVDFVVIEWNKD